MSLLDYLPKNLPFLSPKPTQEYFFALNISQTEVEASVWGLEGKNLKIINTAKVPFGTDPAQDQGASLVESANRALDEALLDFQPEPRRILFGVPDSWLQDDNLKENYLKILRHLVKELDINPMAYVSTTHAITHYLQKDSGVPATIILVSTTDPLVVTVVKGGKILGNRALKRSEDLPQDIEKGLSSFSNIEVLPSKISLYGSGDMEKLKDELTTYNWMSTLPFLHLPKVEILPTQVEIKSLSLAGASEIEPEADFKDQELSSKATPVRSMEEELAPTGMPSPALEAGFVAGDIANEEQESRVQSQELGEANVVPERTVAPMGSTVQEPVATQRLVDNPLLSKVQSLWASGVSFLKSKGISLPKLGPLNGNKQLIIPGALILLLALGYFFFLKATVTIYVDPKVLEKDATVTADPSVTSVDESNKVIPGKIISTDLSGSGKGTATGTKSVGDPAKGGIIVYNETNSPSSFSPGTVLVDSAAGLEFVMSDNIASISGIASLDSATPGAFGQATAHVTASQIGPDSNLAANTVLSIKGQSSSDFSAKVDSGGLSGGTSKNVTVVTSDDQKRALADVSSQLRSQAQSKLQAQLTGDQKILSEGLNESITSTSYSKQIGDQATDFTINLSARYKGTSYSDTDLKTMVAKLVQTNIPDGYQLNLSETTTQADVSKLEPDGKLIFLAKFKANLIPNLDLQTIKKNIKGQTPTGVADYLKGVDNVIGTDISFEPITPFGPLARIPFLDQNISFNVTTK